MITIDDYKKEDGTIDWKKYNEAEVNNGERCFECGNYIGIGGGIRRLCYSCNHQDDESEWDDDSRIRCPKCKNIEDVHDTENYDLYQDDIHEVTCSECGYTYEVKTQVSYNFTSPELLKND